MKCSEVTWDMKVGGDTLDELRIRSDSPTPPGTLLWQPKGGEGHIVVEGQEERDYGYGIPPLVFPVCECGKLDFEDHHWVILRPGDA